MNCVRIPVQILPLTPSDAKIEVVICRMQGFAGAYLVANDCMPRKQTLSHRQLSPPRGPGENLTLGLLRVLDWGCDTLMSGQRVVWSPKIRADTHQKLLEMLELTVAGYRPALVPIQIRT